MSRDRRRSRSRKFAERKQFANAGFDLIRKHLTDPGARAVLEGLRGDHHNALWGWEAGCEFADAVRAYVDPPVNPGERVVDGERMYSADWLGDTAEVIPFARRNGG